MAVRLTRPGRERLMLLAGLCLFVASRTGAAVIYRMQVDRNGDLYHAAAVAHLCVTPAEAYAALVDFAHFPDMNPDIRKAVTIKKLSPHSQIVYMETRACIGFFCRTLKQMQQFTELSSRDLVAVTLAQGSNVKQASSSWHLQADGKGTRLYWQTSLEPDFWVPPLIGSSLLRTTLLQQGERFMAGIERHSGRFPCPAR
ncbi:MAG TPA: hypothetical protein VFX47_02010 [Gammaproteobacteria bacterium]|nr:hypothetical protein [Gammaproteobacteria bacterium]